MAYRHYMVHGRKARLEKVRANILSAIGNLGDPLIMIGAARALVSSGVARALARTSPGRSTEDILRSMGAARVDALNGDAEIAPLLQWREPGELQVGRFLPSGGLVQGDHDWHLVRTRIVDAWRELGAPDAIDWGSVRVGQIDTGYTENPALGWSQGQSPFVLTDLDRNFFSPSWNSEVSPAPWEPYDAWSALDPLSGAFGGHGTRTGSVLAGLDLSAPARTTPDDARVPVAGYFGAAPCVPYVPVRISNSVWINDVTDGLRAAIDWLVEDAGCGILTLSMGAALPSTLPKDVCAAIDRAYDKGVIFCCAAGNVIDTVVAPARHPRTIAVAGSTPSDEPWVGSSFGAQVDVCAPAWPIRRANTTRFGRFEYGYGDGTSFATPLVAGTAAMWLRKHEHAIATRYPSPWMRAAAFRTLLRDTARKPPHWNTADYGSGILDAHALLTAPLPAAASLEPEPQAGR